MSPGVRFNPHITVVKTLAPGQSATPTVGTTVHFRITVTNDGDTPLSNILLSDPNAPNCNRNPLLSRLNGLSGSP